MNLYDGFNPIAFVLSAETENRILMQVANEIAQEQVISVLSAYPNFQVPGFKIPDIKTRLGNYTKRTDAEDEPFLKDPDYIEKMRKGLYPPPVSQYWNNLAGMPDVFLIVQKDFIHVMNTLVGDLGGGE